jgi:hypothetical protein
MEYGCRIWDEQGYIMLDTTDHTARLIYSTTKSGSSSGSTYIPEADGNQSVVFAASESGTSLSVSISPSGILTWAPVRDWDQSIISGTTLILVYVCDERV